LKEFETHILLAERVGFTESTRTAALLKNAEGVGKMLNALINSLKAQR
jgi:four helix bundle protein